MKSIDIKNLAFLISWTLCMGYILIFEFSWVALVALILLFLYAGYRTLFQTPENQQQSGLRMLFPRPTNRNLFYHLPVYLLLSNIFIWVVIIEANYHTIFVSDYYFDMLQSMGSRLALWMIPVFLVVFTVLLIFLFAFRRNPLLGEFFAYALPFFIFSFIFYLLTGNMDLVIAWAWVTVMYIYVGVCKRLYANETSVLNKGFYIISGILYLVLLLISETVYRQACTPLYPMETIIQAGQKWYHMLILFVMTLAVLVITFTFGVIQQNFDAYDIAALSVPTFSIPVFYFTLSIYSGVRWILLGVYLLIAIFIQVRCLPSAVKDQKRKRLEAKKRWAVKEAILTHRFLYIPILSLVTIGLLIFAHFGHLWVALSLSVTTLILWSACKKKAPSMKDEVYLARIAKNVLTWIFTNAFVVMLIYNRHIDTLIILTLLYAFFLLFLFMMNRNPDIYQKNKILQFGQFLLPLMLLVFCLVIPMVKGSQVTLVQSEASMLDQTTEGERVIVRADAQGIGNQVESIRYCWIQTAEDYADSLDETDSTVYMTLNENNGEIILQEGLLKIVVKDTNGVITISEHWFGKP